MSILSTDIQIFFIASTRTCPKTWHPHWQELSYCRNQFVSSLNFRNSSLCKTVINPSKKLIVLWSQVRVIFKILPTCRANASAYWLWAKSITEAIQDRYKCLWTGSSFNKVHGAGERWGRGEKLPIQDTSRLTGIPMTFSFHEHSWFWAAL